MVKPCGEHLCVSIEILHISKGCRSRCDAGTVGFNFDGTDRMAMYVANGKKT